MQPSQGRRFGPFTMTLLRAAKSFLVVNVVVFFARVRLNVPHAGAHLALDADARGRRRGDVGDNDDLATK